MFVSILVSIVILSIVSGLFFRSVFAFFATAFSLSLLIYPRTSISLLIAYLVYKYFSKKGDNHELPKLNPPSGRDDEPS